MAAVAPSPMLMSAVFAAASGVSVVVSAIGLGISWGVTKKSISALEEGLAAVRAHSHEFELALMDKADKTDLAELKSGLQRANDRLDRILERLGGDRPWRP